MRKPNAITLIDLIKALEITPNEIFCDLINTVDSDTTEVIRILSEVSGEDRNLILGIIKNCKALSEKK